MLLNFKSAIFKMLYISITSVARTLIAHSHGCFELVIQSLEKNSRFGIIQDDFLFYIKMVYCVYSLESPQ